MGSWLRGPHSVGGCATGGGIPAAVRGRIIGRSSLGIGGCMTGCHAAWINQHHPPPPPPPLRLSHVPVKGGQIRPPLPLLLC